MLISDFQGQFFSVKDQPSDSFSLKNITLGECFLSLKLFDDFNFLYNLFLKCYPTFDILCECQWNSKQIKTTDYNPKNSSTSILAQPLKYGFFKPGGADSAPHTTASPPD